MGILGYEDRPAMPPRQPSFSEQGDLVPSWVDWLNATALWHPERASAGVAHPHDKRLIEVIPAKNSLPVNRLGPFRPPHGTAKTVSA